MTTASRSGSGIGSGRATGRDPVPRLPADLRLLSAATGSWAGAFLGGVLQLAVCWCLVGVLLLGAAWISRRSGSARRAAAVGLGLLAAGLTVGSVSRLPRTGGPIAELARQEGIGHVELTISGDPQRMSSVPGMAPSVRISAQLRELTAGGRRWSAHQPVLVFAPQASWGALLPSTRVAVSADFRRPKDTAVAAVIAVHRPPVTIRGPSRVQRWAGRIRTGLRRAAHGLPRSERGLLPGIVVGDTSLLPPADTADFRAAGLTHLTAVSGANVAVVVAAVFGLLRWSPFGIRTRAAVSAGTLLGFVVLARPTPSVLRAGAMGLLALTAIALGRPRVLPPALLGTATALALFRPALAAQPGFAMSVLATMALLVLAPGWTAYLRERLPVQFAPLAAWLAVPLAAQVACAPVIAAISGSVSLASIPANLLALPAVPPATVLGLIAAVSSVVSPGLAGGCCALAGIPCRWLVGVAHACARLPMSTVTAPSGTGGLICVGAVTAGLAVAVRTRSGRRTLALAAIILMAAALAGLH